MSSGSERMIENQQERNDERNAAKMGITVEELQSCEFDYDEDSTDDGVVTGMYIKFDRENSPKEILAKIDLDDQGRFEIFDDGEDELEEEEKEN